MNSCPHKKARLTLGQPITVGHEVCILPWNNFGAIGTKVAATTVMTASSGCRGTTATLNLFAIQESRIPTSVNWWALFSLSSRKHASNFLRSA